MDYKAAIEELQKIITEIENNQIGVDELSAKVKRGMELIKLCTDKLTTVENDMTVVLKELESEKK
jgi:exodeoxyribonuclease VII small subunit